MVSYYNAAAMFRHQQSVSAGNNVPFQGNNPWYPGGYHPHTAHQIPGPPAPPFLPQEEPQMWHNGHTGMFQHEFSDFVHQAIPALQPHLDAENQGQQLPSPTVTVSGSEMSSPGAHNGNVSPQGARPPPARSPYEWIKKTSYQQQPNPGKTRTKDKYRVVYTDHQRIELEKEFTFNNKYITIRRKSELAASLGLSERQVKIWFQNRRAKERKQNKKRVEEKQQIEMYTTAPMSGPIINQHTQQLHQQHQQMEPHSILPTVVPPPAMAMQRFMEQPQPLKLEPNENEQLG